MNSSLKLSPDRCTIFPLGGLGEIGKNMMAFSYGDTFVLVDAGVMFPREDMPGVDLIIPDIQFVVENREKLKGIFLTHGHEDHIGALPYLLSKLKAPVYGTRLTLALVKEKLHEFGLVQETSFHEISQGSVIPCGEISVEFFSTIHSIHDSVGIVLNTPLGRVVHSGDFKFDHTPVKGMSMDLKTLADLGKAGVLVLLSDSTYAERPGYSLPERIVGRSLREIFSRAKGRVLIATFASSLPRIQQIIEVSEELGRKICFIGKSMVENVRIALELGYLSFSRKETLIQPEALLELAPSSVVLVTTGSQGEPFSALSLIAARSHRFVEIIPGDTVVISASPIPGNEGLVFRTLNQIYRQGGEVICTLTTRQDDLLNSNVKVHVQGHAGQEELKLFLNLLRPKFFIPIHGEYRHLLQHARLAYDVGIPPENVVIAVDGDQIEVSREEIKIANRLPLSNIFIHGQRALEAGKSIIKERRALGEDGILVVVMTLKKETGQLLCEPEIVTKGFMSSKEFLPMVCEVKKISSEFFKNCNEKRLRDPETLKGNLKGELNKFFGEAIGRKPIIIPVFTWL